MANNYDPGRYKATVVDQGFGMSGNGKEFFCLTVRPTKVQRDDYEEDCRYEGDRDVKLFLTDKTIDFQLAILRDLGWGGTDFDELFNEEHSFVGQEIDVYNEHREYKGKYYDQFQVHRETGKLRDKSKVASLTERFSDQLKATAKDTPKRDPDPVANPETDIPF